MLGTRKEIEAFLFSLGFKNWLHFILVSLIAGPIVYALLWFISVLAIDPTNMI